MNVIEIEHLSKKYGSKYAVNDLNLNVKAGEIFGFLGPNGAGKTTTIKMLMGLIKPSAGNVSIFGRNIKLKDFKFKARLGFLDSELNLPEGESLDSILKLIANITPPDQAYLTKLKSVLELGQQSRVALANLSKGTRQKVAIILAMAHNPDLLILDEPTEGLDPLAQEAFYQLINERRSVSKTTFFSSHNLSEVQRVCTQIGFIKDAKLIKTESTAELGGELGGKIFTIKFSSSPAAADVHSLKSAGVKNIQMPSKTELTFLAGNNLQPLLKVLAGMQIADIEVANQSLEDAFLKLYTGSKASSNLSSAEHEVRSSHAN